MDGIGRLFGIKLIHARKHLVKRSSDRDTGDSASTLLTNRSSTYANNINATHYFSNGNANSVIGSHLHPCERQPRSGDFSRGNDEGVTSLLELLHHSQADSKIYKVLKCHVLLMEKSLKKVEKNTRELLSVMRETEHKKQVKLLRLEWQIVAMTLDRVLFVIFLIAILSSLFTLFPRPYQLQAKVT